MPFELKVPDRRDGVERTVLIDAADWSLVKGYSWRIMHMQQHMTVVTSLPPDEGPTRVLSLGRLLFGLKFKDGMIVTFRDKNTLNCTRANMMVIRRGLQQFHARKYRSSKLPYRGIEKRSGKWRARVVIEGKRRVFGSYDTPEEAALKFNEVAKATYGDLAFLNEVPSTHLK